MGCAGSFDRGLRFLKKQQPRVWEPLQLSHDQKPKPESKHQRAQQTLYWTSPSLPQGRQPLFSAPDRKVFPRYGILRSLDKVHLAWHCIAASSCAPCGGTYAASGHGRAAGMDFARKPIKCGFWCDSVPGCVALGKLPHISELSYSL